MYFKTLKDVIHGYLFYNRNDINTRTFVNAVIINHGNIINVAIYNHGECKWLNFHWTLPSPPPHAICAQLPGLENGKHLMCE